MYYCRLIKIMHVSLGGNQTIHPSIHSFIQKTASQLRADKVIHWKNNDDSFAGSRVWCWYQVIKQTGTMGPVPQQEMAQVLWPRKETVREVSTEKVANGVELPGWQGQECKEKGQENSLGIGSGS